MNHKINQFKKIIFQYISFFILSAITCFSIFIHYKNQITNEHIQFLQAQIPTLKSENLYQFKELKRNSRYMKSRSIAFKKFEPIITFLGEDIKNISDSNLDTINKFLQEELKTPDLLATDNLKNISSHLRNQILTYRIVNFRNKLIRYVTQAKVGYGPCSLVEDDWSILDFWSKEKYHIYLSYHPSYTFETPFEINGKVRNENALLFGPERTGIHTFDISLSHFDEKGIEKKLNFTKEIVVLP